MTLTIAFTTGNGVIERTTDNGASWWDQPLDRAQGVTSFSGLKSVAFTDSGRGTAGGVYFCRLQAGDFVMAKRLLLLR